MDVSYDNKGSQKNQARIVDTVNFFNMLYGKISELHFGYTPDSVSKKKRRLL